MSAPGDSTPCMLDDSEASPEPEPSGGLSVAIVKEQGDWSGFDRSEQVRVQLRGLVRDQRVAGQFQIQVGERIRIVKQVVCLINDDAVGNPLVSSNLVDAVKQRSDVAPLIDVAHL